MKRYFCKKQNKVVDLEKDCDSCIKESKSGFLNKLMCQQFNLQIVEENKYVV